MIECRRRWFRLKLADEVDGDFFRRLIEAGDRFRHIGRKLVAYDRCGGAC
jgi:hypothetical protein